MKKGISLPIQFIIIVIVSVVVLVVILMFFFSAKAGAGSGITVSQAIAQCQNACLEDQSSLTSDPDLDDGSTGGPDAICDSTHAVGSGRFCTLKPIVETVTKDCPAITSCTLQYGTKACKITTLETCGITI